MATYDIRNGTSSITFNPGDIINCPYSNQYYTLTLPKGDYHLECWGAQGGSYSSWGGGLGGYSYGDLSLKEATQVYLYAGGQPSTSTTLNSVLIPGGFNGGGSGAVRTWDYTTYGQAGGGASDIRIAGNTYYYRVIVAGGGGGAAIPSNVAAWPSDVPTLKCGGGISGASAFNGQYAGTATQAGDGGSFGVGGSTIDTFNYNYGPGGGGGGWYGGGASKNVSDDETSYCNQNGGGSGYVYTEATASQYPSGGQLNNAYYLTNAATIAGDQIFTRPDGTKGKGNINHGYVRITVLKSKEPIIYVKTSSSIWTPADAVYVKINENTWARGGI